VYRAHMLVSCRAIAFVSMNLLSLSRRRLTREGSRHHHPLAPAGSRQIS
jgi:hypothetical protein